MIWLLHTVRCSLNERMYWLLMFYSKSNPGLIISDPVPTKNRKFCSYWAMGETQTVYNTSSNYLEIMKIRIRLTSNCCFRALDAMYSLYYIHLSKSFAHLLVSSIICSYAGYYYCRMAVLGQTIWILCQKKTLRLVLFGTRGSSF